MSRFGKLPVTIPQGVSVESNTDTLTVKGPKGALVRALPRGTTVTVENGEATVKVAGSSKMSVALQGTIKSHLTNMVKGVTEGWKKQLELVGSGYRAEVRGSDLVLNIGYSHPITFKAPQDISFKVEKSLITVEGLNKDVVGQLAAQIRETRKPDPYKAKGVKYIDEIVRRKAGKQAAKAS